MDTQVQEPQPDKLKTITTVVYALQAASFMFGFTAVVAVIINYVKRDDVRGSWLESHFRWQIRTFWYALLWALLVVLVSVPLTLVLIGFAIWAIGLFALGIWATYRIVRGWLALNDRRPLQV